MSKNYDIIYSLTAHEYPDVINNTIQNIKMYKCKFHQMILIEKII